MNHSIPGFHSGNMKSLFVLLSISSVALGAPFDFVSFSNILHKAEMIYKGSLDSIPSPSSSVKIQIIDGKIYWR